MKKIVIAIFLLFTIMNVMSQDIRNACSLVPLNEDGSPVEDPCIGTDLQNCIDCVNCAAYTGRYHDEVRCSFGFMVCYSIAIDECQFYHNF